MRIAIIGCGEIGVLCARRLLDAGHQVTGIRRNVNALPRWLESRTADVTHTDSLGFIQDSCFDFIIYQVAAGGFTEEAYHQAYSQGLANVIQHCDSRKTRLLFVSSTGVYHQNDGEWVDESSETRPSKFNGQIMLAAEKLVTDYGLGCCVRFSGIYGPGRTRLIERVRNGETGEYNDGYTNRIHVEDCAGVLSHLVRFGSTQSLQPVYLASDSLPALRSDVFRFLASELGVDVIGQKADQSGVKSAKNGTAAKRIAGSKQCNNQQLLATGYKLIYPDYRAGYRQVIATLKQ